MRKFRFRVLHRDKKTKARVGEIATPHGVIKTPAFVAVGTQATVKSLTPEELNTLGVQLFFVNTYHAYLRPGLPVIKKFGGLHRFMGWDKPLITDSGGFQVFSLGRGRGAEVADENFVNITDDGVEFRSHWDGSRHFFTPEKSIEIQHALAADITIAFDECTPYPATHTYAHKAMERTHRWARRSLEVHKKLKIMPQALYGVVQGSVFEDLRKESAKYIAAMDFDGIAVGGVAVGESKKEMVDVLDWTVPLLPNDKPRHLLGVGEIDDIFELVERGVDTFDCVQPTRLARMGRVLTGNYPIIQLSNNPINKWEMDITKKEYAEDVRPIEERCECYTCQHFSRAYLHHLFRVRELLAYRLATIHNIHFVNTLMGEIRRAIITDSFLELKKRWL